MNKRSLTGKLNARLLAFKSECRGNVSMIFALAIIPIIGAVGAAVDYSHASSVRTSMQAAVDATALMLSKNAATLTTSQLSTQATNYFNAMFTRTDATNVVLTPSYTTSGGSQIVFTATASVATNFMGLFGISSIPVSASSTVKWGNARLRVALVLDNTGSMSSAGKLTALKTATNNLLTQLQSAATQNGDVYVSIIPFVKDVTVDPSANYNAAWIDWTDWEAEPQILDTNKGGAKPSNWAQIGPGSSCPFTSSTYGFSCVASAGSSSTVSKIPSSGTTNGFICPGQDGGNKISWKSGIKYNGCYTSVSATGTSTGSSAACPSNSSSYVSCSCSGSGSSKKCTWTYYDHVWRGTTAAAPDHSTWNGNITDRGSWSGPSTGNYDTNVTTPTTSNTATLFPAEQYAYPIQSMMPLNYDWASMKTLVNNMVANGSTNQNIGLVLGWQSLVGGGPFPTPPAMDPNYKYQQVIILLTDGLNTQDRWYGNGSATATQVDTRQQMTCNNVKAAGITLYTVQVNTDGDPTSTLLQNCASSSDKFFLLTSSSQIVTTFNQIGTALSNLRIAN
jgi:Flp pilus assembly protein TadG